MMMHALSQSIPNVITDPTVESLIRSREADPATYDPNPNGYFAAPPDVVPTDYPAALVKVPMYRWPALATSDLSIVWMQRDESERALSFVTAFGGADTVNVPYYEAGEAALAIAQSVTVVQFADVLNDPVGEFTRLQAAGWPIDPSLCASVVDPNLWRMRG